MIERAFRFLFLHAALPSTSARARNDLNFDTVKAKFGRFSSNCCAHLYTAVYTSVYSLQRKKTNTHTHGTHIDHNVHGIRDYCLFSGIK